MLVRLRRDACAADALDDMEDRCMEDGAASRRHAGELFSALAAMGFGSAYVATSFALEAFGPVAAAAWRAFLAALALVAIFILRRGRVEAAADAADPLPAEDRPDAARSADTAVRRLPPDLTARAVRLLALSTLAGPLFLTSMNQAVAHMGAAVAAFVAGLYAVLAAVLAPVLLPERISFRVLAGFVLAVIGTAMLAELAPDAADLTGLGWGVLAAVAFALYLVLTRRWSTTYRLDGMTVALANAALTAMVLGGFLLLTDPGSLTPASPPVEALVALGWMAAVAALGPILTVASLRRIPAARSAAFLLLNPITATVLAVVLLGERPSALQVAGGALVLLGMAAATLPARAGRGSTAEVGVREAAP
jgi:DME family drug/metabolite transporter